MYNKLTVSSVDSNNDVSDSNKRLSSNLTRSKENLKLHHFNRIEEVDESASDVESTEKTIQASAVANYHQENPHMILSKNQLRLGEHINQHLCNDEDMKTKKNYDEIYRRQKQQMNLHDSMEDYIHEHKSDNSDDSGHSSSANKKVKYQPEYEAPQTTRNISRHRRISAPENYHPTIIRNMSNPEIIEEYDVTERIPIEVLHSSKHREESRRKEYAKYADKYSLTKNCKYYKQLQMQADKPRPVEAESIENDTDSLEERFEDLKQKRGHRRVVSENYN